MCMMCMILSPNCYTVTIVEYSSTDVMLLRSCLSVLSEHVAKTKTSEEEEKCVFSAIPR